MSTLVVQPPVKRFDYIPLVYGSVAFSLGKTDDGTTHRWTIYVRGVNGKDLTGVISKVVFKLHPTCTYPVVECTQHPYETTQPGWGEFPATIEISFRDEKLPIVSFIHHLKLHQTVPAGNTPSTRPVVSEVYEEIVFRGPSQEFSDRILDFHQSAPCLPNGLSPYWQTFNEEADLAAIQKAHAFVKAQLQATVSDYSKTENELRKVTEKIARQKAFQKAKEAQAAASAAAAATIVGEVKIEPHLDQQLGVVSEPEAKRVKLDA